VLQQPRHQRLGRPDFGISTTLKRPDEDHVLQPVAEREGEIDLDRIEHYEAEPQAGHADRHRESRPVAQSVDSPFEGDEDDETCDCNGGGQRNANRLRDIQPFHERIQEYPRDPKFAKDFFGKPRRHVGNDEREPAHHEQPVDPARDTRGLLVSRLCGIDSQDSVLL
jgi:hypothetical protein